VIPPFILAWLTGPALSAVKGFGALIASALRNPYVIGALVACAFFLLWKGEEDGKAKLRARLATNDATWAGALGVERQAFHTADDALRGQNIAVQALWQAGQAKVAQSRQIAARAAPVAAVAQSQANAILIAGKGTDCASAQATFEAARRALQ
jgi:hypothetical protein